MTKNRLIIAAAGSGKTTYLVEESIKSNKNILITTYTRQNELEIKSKFLSKLSYIPSNITIDTWFSFLLNHGVKPFQGHLIENKITGLNFVNGRSGFKTFLEKCENCKLKNINDWICKKCKKPIYYPKSDTSRFYFDSNQRIFSDKISQFVVDCNRESNGKVFNRIERVFDTILIDEVQDLTGYDLEVIKLLLKSSSNIVLVGDPRQTTYSTHFDVKHKKYRGGKIKEFIQDHCKNTRTEFDESTLTGSYRCISSICSYSNKLFPDLPNIESKNIDTSYHNGVFFVHESELQDYLSKYRPHQLRNDKKNNLVNPEFPVMNFGESKGLTFDRTIIYPTIPFLNWILDPSSKLADASRSDFYVALTRAKFSVAILIPEKYRKNFGQRIPGASIYGAQGSLFD